jgi:hypothetical protein
LPTFKISQLTTAVAVSATNQFEINQNAASRSLEVSVLSSYVRGLDTLVPVNVSVSSATAAVSITQTGTGPGINVLGGVRFRGATAGFVGLVAPASVSSVTYTLPAADGTNGQVLTTNGTNILSFTSVAGGGGGLTNFTDSATSATPNGTVPVNSLAAFGGATNIDVAVVPKGTGAFALRVADNTTTGGNKRGTNSVDLQTLRTNANQVASGVRAVAIGTSNRADQPATVAIGENNAATGSYGVAIGTDNTAGSTSTACGYSVNASGVGAAAIGAVLTVSGQYAFGAGFSNTVSGNFSSAPGGSRATTNSILGLLAYGFNGTSTGQNQMSYFGARPITTDGAARRATADDAAASATNQLALRNSSAFTFEGKVIARDTSTNDIKSWIFTGAIKRGANAAATALVGTPTVTVVAEDAAASTWAVALAADTTNGTLAVNVTGQATKTIRWTVVVNSAEVN